MGLALSWLNISYRPDTDNEESQKYLVCDPCFRWLDKTIEFRITEIIRIEALRDRIDKKNGRL